MVDLHLALPGSRPAGAELNLQRLEAALLQRGRSVGHLETPALLGGHLQVEKAAILSHRFLGQLTMNSLIDLDLRGAPVVTATLKSDVVGHALASRWICNAQTDIPWHSRHSRPLRGELLLRTWRRMVRRASIVVVPSTLYAETLVERGLVRPDQARVIPNIIPPVQAASHDREPHVVWVGRLVPQKDVRLALEAVRRLDLDVRLTIVGDGPLRTDTQEAIFQAGLARRVTCLGWVQDPAPVIAGYRVLLNTSHTETFGNVMGEALASRTRVVATPTDGSRFLSDAVVGGISVSKSRDADELAALLQEALDREPLETPPEGLRLMSGEAVARRWEELL